MIEFNKNNLSKTKIMRVIPKVELLLGLRIMGIINDELTFERNKYIIHFNK